MLGNLRQVIIFDPETKKWKIFQGACLSHRQSQIMRALQHGETQAGFARKHKIQPKTAHKLLRRLHEKFGTTTSEQIAIIAYQAFGDSK